MCSGESQQLPAASYSKSRPAPQAAAVRQRGPIWQDCARSSPCGPRIDLHRVAEYKKGMETQQDNASDAHDIREYLDIKSHRNWFMAYATAQCTKEEKRQHGDVAPMLLKLRHSLAVLGNAESIVAGEDFSPPLGRVCLLAALYHDVGRFEQYLRYHTFKDSESCDHGQLGVRILKRECCLIDEDTATRKAVMAAVGLHNRFALPQGLPEVVAVAAHVVRDADKLDILRVMDEHLSGPAPYNPTVVLSLPDTPGLCSKAILAAAGENRVAAYADLRSVNDFRVLLGTWFFDMHFASSRNQFVEDGHARNLLLGLPADAPYGEVRQIMLEKTGGRA